VNINRIYKVLRPAASFFSRASLIFIASSCTSPLHKDNSLKIVNSEGKAWFLKADEKRRMEELQKSCEEKFPGRSSNGGKIKYHISKKSQEIVVECWTLDNEINSSDNESSQIGAAYKPGGINGVDPNMLRLVTIAGAPLESLELNYNMRRSAPTGSLDPAKLQSTPYEIKRAKDLGGKLCAYFNGSVYVATDVSFRKPTKPFRTTIGDYITPNEIVAKVKCVPRETADEPKGQPGTDNNLIQRILERFNNPGSEGQNTQPNNKPSEPEAIARIPKAPPAEPKPKNNYTEWPADCPFTEQEFIASNTAKELKVLNNFDTPANKGNAIRLCAEYATPIFNALKELGVPKLTSGYRSQKVNEAVGGVPNSAHKSGLAMDFYVPGVTLDKMLEVILQLILEGKVLMPNQVVVELDTGVIHLAAAPEGGKPAGEVLLRQLVNGQIVYSSYGAGNVNSLIAKLKNKRNIKSEAQQIKIGWLMNPRFEPYFPYSDKGSLNPFSRRLADDTGLRWNKPATQFANHIVVQNGLG
jgi:zinc D-Ala-D-Ala carboxypeptidase